MFTDPRGGHNRKQINQNFFKSWSPQMAYVLGLIMADGAVEDVRKSSRTCYIQISSIDVSLLEQVKTALSSNHPLQIRKAAIIIFRGKKCHRSKSFNLRIGSKSIFQDLVNLGITPRKSLRLKLPDVSRQHFRFLLRGYFDGDGCVNIYQPKNRKKSVISVIFTSGCKEFLESLSQKIATLVGLPLKTPYFNFYAYRLLYRNKNAFKLLSYQYKELEEAPYLERKYKKFQQVLALGT